MTAMELVQLAIEARTRAYAPYSLYAVGAAVLTASGRVFTGCNVENASYGLTICAERTAIFTAVTAGERDILEIAVATANGGSPCGACRQVISEFGTTIAVHIADRHGKFETRSIAELLPAAFGARKLED